MAIMKILDGPHAAVRCIHKGHKYILAPEKDEPIILIREGTQVVELGDKDIVTDQEGNPIHAADRFYRTVETIDPYHALLDMV